jgi:serine/threonine protein kinase
MRDSSPTDPEQNKAKTTPSSAPRKTWEPPSAEELAQFLPQYDIERILGRGGMGAVYKGTQKSLERPVAIKILSAEMEANDPSFAERFKNEARAMGKLSHPGIVSVFDSGTTEDNMLYIVMEFVEGTDVAKMIAQQGRLHTEHAMAITAHVCDALQYAHERGIIHRDIKPANIMVGYDGAVKVADFGLAKMSHDGRSGLTQSGMAMGTLYYMAPEALILGSSVDHRADVYAVGVMLYQMLTGKLPQGMFKLPSLLVPGLDPRYDAIISKALREDRAIRYQSVFEMRHDLDAILTQPVVKVDASNQKAPAALNTQARPQRPDGQPFRPAAPEVITRPKKQRFSPLWTVLIVMCGIAGWLFMSHPNGRTLPAPDQTLKAQGNSSQASQTANSSAMELLVDVDFTQTNEGFPDTISNKRINATWKDGHYQLTALSSAIWWPGQPVIQKLKLQDFVCEVEAWVPREAAGNWGIGMIGKMPWIGVKMNAAGKSEVYRYDEMPLVRWMDTAAFPAGGEWNQVRLEVANKRVRVYVNRHFVTESSLERLNFPVGLTLFLQTPQPGFEVWFRRIRVWQPRLAPAVSTAPTTSGTSPPSAKPNASTPPAKEDKAANASQRVIDLIPLVDVKRDALKGTWQMTPEGLKAHTDARTEHKVLLRHPTSANEFDIEAEFTLTRDEIGSIELQFPHKGRFLHCFFQMFPKNGSAFYGFPKLDGIDDITRTETISRLNTVFHPGVRQIVSVQVRDGGLKALHNGKAIIDWKGDPMRFSGAEKNLSNGTEPFLGLAIGDGVGGLKVDGLSGGAVFHRLSLIEYQTASSKTPTAAALPNGPASWTDTKGRSLQATFKTIASGNVLLEIAGKVQPVPLNTLSAESQQLARDYQQQSQAAANAANHPSKATKDAPFTNSLGMKFVPVPGTQVLFCVHETRRQDYAAFAGEQTALSSAWKNMRRNGVPSGHEDNHPVVGVSWNDAKAFCYWLSSKEGMTHRLPTDKEWSCAVGIGQTEDQTGVNAPIELSGKIPGLFPWGAEWPPPQRAANLSDESLKASGIRTNNGHIIGYMDGFPTTAPVMSFLANPLGIHDLSGNVTEWCEDWVDAGKTKKVHRGLSWDNSEKTWLLSSHRTIPNFTPPPERGGDYLGFRCVIELPAP